MSKGHKDEGGSGDSDHPLGWNSGETLYVTGDDGTGEVQTELGSVDEMLEIAGVASKEMNGTARPLGELGGEVAQEELKSLDERIRERLPDDAFLTDDGRLGAENNRSSQGTDYLNGKRRWVLKKMDAGKSPSEIYKNAEFTDSYIYRTRSVFGFLLEDDLLREVFIEDGGEYAPTHEASSEEEVKVTPEEHQEAKEEAHAEATVPLEEAKKMAENAYQNGLEEGKEQASPESESVDSVFNEDEWWDVMKTLLNNGEEELARRITSKIL